MQAANLGAGTFDQARAGVYAISTTITPVTVGLTLTALFIVIYGTISAFAKDRLYVGEAILATAFGIAIGPVGCEFVNPRAWGGGAQWNTVLLQTTRLVIALSVFAVGAELPPRYVRKHWQSLAILLGPVMLVGWLLSALLIYLLIPDLDLLCALVIAAALTPTDPILAASIVGKGSFAEAHIPDHIRHLLQAESGCNDGAAFPFLYFGLMLLLRAQESAAVVIGRWLYLVMLYQIALGILIGAVIGTAALQLLKFAKRRQLIDRESMVAMDVALALFSCFVTTLTGADDLLAAFTCGTAFAWDGWCRDAIEKSNFSEIIARSPFLLLCAHLNLKKQDLLVNCATFILVGATIPFDTWSADYLTLTPWRLVVLALCILGVRRIPVVIALQRFVPDLHTWREAAFSAHFGPMGIGALFIATLAASKLPTPDVPPSTSLDVLSLSLQPITYFIVLSALILCTCLSIPFFTLSKHVNTISRNFTPQVGSRNTSTLSLSRDHFPRSSTMSSEVVEKSSKKSGAATPLEVTADTETGSSELDKAAEERTRLANIARLKKRLQQLGGLSETASMSREEEDVKYWQQGRRVIIERNAGEDISVVDRDALTFSQSSSITSPAPSTARPSQLHHALETIHSIRSRSPVAHERKM